MGKRPFMILMAIITLVFSVLYVRSRFLLVELSYKLTKAQQIHKDLEQKKQDLSLELAVLKSPARVEAIASRELGLKRRHDLETINLEVSESQ
ncbi:MAG: cell division protein FtsL [Bdellovibrionales bacterium]|nr:cell division protein FtsL [Bdellovibrionales bacterium]